MAIITSNPAALAVPPGLLPGDAHRGALALRGYLDAGSEEMPADPVRLYADESYRVWWEFPRSAILHQIPPSPDPLDMVDVVWLMRETAVKKCTVGYAYMFVDDGSGIDPAGGPHGPHWP